MEETQTQEVSIPKPVLSPDDMSRINNCDFYAKAKEVIKSVNEYKDFEVGAAVHIVRKHDGKMVSSDYEGKFPEKYIIVHNDDGFLFVKRVNANGKPGVAITCVTIDYPSDSYELRVDNGYVESMLLDTQDTYDPLADAKDMVKRKGKASRLNAKKRLLFDTAVEAYAYLKKAKVGDKFWTSDYAYGGGIQEYTVKSIEVRPAAKTQASPNGWGRSYNQDHYYEAHNFPEVVKVELKVVDSGKRYSYDKTLEFTNISKENSGNYYFYYAEKPVDPSELAS
jgi:hypothetical protein